MRAENLVYLWRRLVYLCGSHLRNQLLTLFWVQTIFIEDVVITRVWQMFDERHSYSAAAQSNSYFPHFAELCTQSTG